MDDHKTSVPFTFDSSIIENALKNIQRRQLNTKTQIDQGLFSEVNRILSSGIDIACGDDDRIDGGFKQDLQTNTEVFAAFKAHRMGRDMASQLLDADGNVKPFRQFKKDTEGIVSHHVNAWLRTEYDTAIRRAHRAAEMRQFIAEADVFPNIEWLPSTAVNPREAHMPFYHHIWPINDPFWDEHKPGDEWGCQCGWESTDKPATDNKGLGGEGVAEPSPGLGGNPAKTGQVFSDDHPYFPSDCAHCGIYNTSIKNRLASVFYDRKKDCYNCPYIKVCINELGGKARFRRNKEIYRRLKEDKNYKHVKYNRASGGMSASHKEHNFDKVGGVYEITAMNVGRQHGHAVIFEKEGGNIIGQRYTEGTWDGMLCEVAGKETGTVENIKKGLLHCASKRTTEVAIIVLPNGGYDESKITRAIRMYRGLEKLHDGQYIPFKRVVCIQDKEIVYDEPF